jgi:hypothetical protein
VGISFPEYLLLLDDHGVVFILFTVAQPGNNAKLIALRLYTLSTLGSAYH